MRHTALAICLAALLTGVIAPQTVRAVDNDAYEVMSQNIALKAVGRYSAREFVLRNDSNTPLDIEVQAQDPTGYYPKDLFIIIPSRIALDRGQSAEIRIQWMGTRAPTEDMPFSLVALTPTQETLPLGTVTVVAKAH